MNWFLTCDNRMLTCYRFDLFLFDALCCACYTLKKGGDPAAPSGTATLLRLSPPHKAHLRKLLPSRVSSPPSGALHSADLTGGVYKARERIHRAMMLRDY